MRKSIWLITLVLIMTAGCSPQAVDESFEEMLEAYKGTYVGDASSIGQILTLLSVEHEGFELQTENSPYGIVISWQDTISESQWDKLAVLARTLFDLVDNAERVSFKHDSEIISFYREHAQAEFSYEEAVDYGYVIGGHGETVNMIRLHEFYECVQAGVPDSIRLVSYTLEGDPIVKDLFYDGTKLHYYEDDRFDSWGMPLSFKGKYNIISSVEDKRNGQLYTDLHLIGGSSDVVAFSYITENDL